MRVCVHHTVHVEVEGGTAELVFCLSLAVHLKGFAFSVPSPDDTFPHTLLGLIPSHSLGVSSMSPTDH